jgi:hypothetical protein
MDAMLTSKGDVWVSCFSPHHRPDPSPLTPYGVYRIRPKKMSRIATKRSGKLVGEPPHGITSCVYALSEAEFANAIGINQSITETRRINVSLVSVSFVFTLSLFVLTAMSIKPYSHVP